MKRDRARGRDPRHHARDPARTACSRARSCSRTRSRTCRRACTWPWSIPGVGGGRRAVALRSGDGRLFVGPDNGLLVPAAEKLGGIEAAHEITNRGLPARARLGDVPRARRLLAGGGASRERGRARGRSARRSSPTSLVRLEVPKPDVDAPADPRLVPLRRPLREHAAEPDAQGSRDARRPSRAPASSSRSRPSATTRSTARTFADARDGEIILYEDAYENIAIAISGGSAAGTFFSAQPGVDVRIRLRRLMLEQLGRKFARFTTNQVVRRPRLWPLFRWLTRAQFNRIAPAWDQRRTPEAFAPLEAALDALDAAARSACSISGPARARAAFLLARRYPEAEVVGVDLAEDMLAEARRLTPPELADRVRFERGRRGAALVSGRLVRPRLAREHDPVLRGAGPRHGAGRGGRLLVLGRAGDADLRAARRAAGASWASTVSRNLRTLRPATGPRCRAESRPGRRL